jgi:hypothetical protein
MADAVDTITIQTPETGPNAPTDAPATDEANKPATAETPAEEPARPEWLPEKFKTPEDMAQAYKELETKQGAQPPSGPTAEETQAQAALKEKGLDFAKYSQEYSENGSLSSASYAEIFAKGITADQVDTFISGQVARAEQTANQVFESVGGKENFEKLIEFAKTNLKTEEINAYNKAVASGDTGEINLVLRGVQAAYNAEFPQEPVLISGKSPSSIGDVFANSTEFQSAIQDPRYLKDAHYRAQVEAKIARSKFFKKA